MKKTFAIFISLCMVLTFFVGCQDFLKENILCDTPLSEEQKAAVKNQIVLQCDTSVLWHCTGMYEPYYGTINDCIIVQTALPGIFTNDLPSGGYQFEIAGYTFRAKNADFGICVYRNGEACELQEAYEKGWLTKEQIGRIHERHKEIYADWLKAVEEWEKSQKESE